MNNEIHETGIRQTIHTGCVDGDIYNPTRNFSAEKAAKYACVDSTIWERDKNALIAEQEAKIRGACLRNEVARLGISSLTPSDCAVATCEVTINPKHMSGFNSSVFTSCQLVETVVDFPARKPY